MPRRELQPMCASFSQWPTIALFRYLSDRRPTTTREPNKHRQTPNKDKADEMKKVQQQLQEFLEQAYAESLKKPSRRTRE